MTGEANQLAQIKTEAAMLNLKPQGRLQKLWREIKKGKYLLIMAAPVIAYYIIFHYIPMYGVIIAFKSFSPTKGIWGSPFVGFRHFANFFGSYYAFRVIRNTILINFYHLLFGFPAPIILALLLNELRSKMFKKAVQTITYLPHFISAIVICGIVANFTSSTGLINDVIAAFGGQRESFLLKPEYFRTIYVSTGIWQGVGWGSIIYLAALSGIDPTLYEATAIDGAGKWRQFIHVTLPGIAPTIVILLILNIGKIMSEGFEKVILLYNQNIYETADIISSFVYRRGLIESDYSFSAAVGLFNSVVNLILISTANAVSRRVNETSLW
ncbi:MAG: putative multiple-sugar transport system permease YteP [Firmicutes bacterium ADurb.Bin193]|nr:MAG: putative multiple-sugar transport system permease YteP [Firmicutes bacterium ADurb.Bin193]